jgi:hypothetical protein
MRRKSMKLLRVLGIAVITLLALPHLAGAQRLNCIYERS